MEELHELELKLVNSLTEKYPTLKSHIPCLRVNERKTTATGITVNLVYENFNGEFEDVNALFSNEENIVIKNLKKGLGYVIDITNGQIEYLEFSTYDEKWDGKIGEFKIVAKE
jgi:hypothetical protein